MMPQRDTRSHPLSFSDMHHRGWLCSVQCSRLSPTGLAAARIRGRPHAAA